MEEPSPVEIPGSKAEWLIPLVLFAGFALVCSWWFLRPKPASAPKVEKDPPMVRAEAEVNPSDKAPSFLVTGGYHFKKGELDYAGYWFAGAALTGDPKGMGIYGAGVIEGLWRPKENDVVKRYVEGAEWLIKGTEKNDPYSIYMVGLMTYKGTTAPPDEVRGLEYIRDAAKLNCKAAIQFLDDLEKKKPPEMILGVPKG